MTKVEKSGKMWRNLDSGVKTTRFYRKSGARDQNGAFGAINVLRQSRNQHGYQGAHRGAIPGA